MRDTGLRKPCEYCGKDLPLGVDKGTRRERSFHFANCAERKTQFEQDASFARDEKTMRLAAVGFTDEQIRVLLDLFVARGTDDARE